MTGDLFGGGPTKTSDAVFSPCRKYRYTLTREWDSTLKKAVFIGLNPSTADETADDPTIRRCIGFAKAWGFGGIVMMNLFAFRATDPKVMKRERDPIGQGNNAHLQSVASDAGVVIAAWGAHGTHLDRAKAVVAILDTVRVEIRCLGFTVEGLPRHPLYMPGSAVPVPYQLPTE